MSIARLAFGILVDALVVRTFVVPALVAIMGRWNWWMPRGMAGVLRAPLHPAAATDEESA